ncbi:MAG: hypothetical protein ACOYL3_22260, partial [Desulfuromonadaceae bacterium]
IGWPSSIRMGGRLGAESALPVPVANYTPSEEEKTLLKHFKQIESNPDRQAVVLIARRLAAKR